jgi:MYXO-CTERM domain-containing protein
MSFDLRLASILAGSALVFAAPMLMPSAAQACGGTFCDAGPTAMPVDQTGENVLFHIGANSVEAHIQIQVDPNAEADQFAWLLPLTTVPEFSVGSQILFDNILAASVPRYGITNNFDFCGGGDWSEEGGEANDTGGDPTGDGDDGGPGGPSVVFQDTVGAFEIVVLEGGTVASIMQWLGDNGYQQDPAAEPILAEYLAEGFVFAAFKLAVESGVEDVHPIVIRYDGTEPCVPIRLTRIAAEDDMDIRVFFLGDARVVPTNYRHVLVNPLKIDWFNNAANYKEVITMAVDAEHAAGNAFVTEYAGPSDIISLAGVFSQAWNPAPFADLGESPVGLYELLTGQNLMFCEDWDNTCTTLHPLLQPLLNQYVPVPFGLDPVDFYTCMTCYEDQIDLAAWNAIAFAEALDERIFKPGQRAADLVNAHPYLTRMYTTISPHEMNADPMFRANPTLPEVGTTRWADQTLHCDGSTTVELPDGRQIYFPPGEQLIWPEFQDAMPWEEAVDQEGMAEAAPLINLSDNTDQINELLDEWNKGRGQGSDNGETGGDAGIDGDSGCGCTTEAGSAGGAALGFGLLGLLGLVRRRRLG